ncbi:MAG: hypothetical protein H5U26_00740 [Immundisolibacter sp.]|uniref:ParB/RepB/Spo0J family partition protein n=1 Tax=Immundisolibacter sp. TaxID=1934948 RepID=UPI0019A2C5E7|nr:ParB/RepB/Spo0J family partition protein [Immundisolibacter sp.]MBC7160622.1 hypothetical protein [Immundisolibacter sp.]
MNLETPDDDDQESPRIRAVFDRLSARVDPPVEDDWESAINNLSERPADHGQPPPPRYRVHPAADIFPMLAAEELDALADDIAEHGLREPLWLYKDPGHGEVLLDGRNRLAACELIGVEPATRYFEGDDPLGFALSQNLHRRHLSVGERAGIAERLLPLFEREAKERKRQAGKEHGRGQGKVSVKKSEPIVPAKSGATAHAGKASEQAARAVGVSSATVEKFVRVKKTDPGLAAKVASGEVSLGRAEREVRERAQQHGGGKATPERPPAPAGELLGADLSSVTSIACAPPDWPHGLPWLDVEGCRVVVDRAVFAGLLAGIERELTAVASTKPAATATPPASQCTAEDYRRTTEGY